MERNVWSGRVSGYSTSGVSYIGKQSFKSSSHALLQATRATWILITLVTRKERRYRQRMLTDYKILFPSIILTRRLLMIHRLESFAQPCPSSSYSSPDSSSSTSFSTGFREKPSTISGSFLCHCGMDLALWRVVAPRGSDFHRMVDSYSGIKESITSIEFGSAVRLIWTPSLGDVVPPEDGKGSRKISKPVYGRWLSRFEVHLKRIRIISVVYTSFRA